MSYSGGDGLSPVQSIQWLAGEAFERCHNMIARKTKAATKLGSQETASAEALGNWNTFQNG